MSLQCTAAKFATLLSDFVVTLKHAVWCPVLGQLKGLQGAGPGSTNNIRVRVGPSSTDNIRVRARVG
jgi:hypothetical protein